MGKVDRLRNRAEPFDCTTYLLGALFADSQKSVSKAKISVGGLLN